MMSTVGPALLSSPQPHAHTPAAQSMRPIARALRVFAHAENLPIIIHCIHGKDRTGLIIALLLLLLGVDEPTVVLDYAKSELELKARAKPLQIRLDNPLQDVMPIPCTRERLWQRMVGPDISSNASAPST